MYVCVLSGQYTYVYIFNKKVYVIYSLQWHILIIKPLGIIHTGNLSLASVSRNGTLCLRNVFFLHRSLT